MTVLPSKRFAIPFGRPMAGASVALPIALVIAWAIVAIVTYFGTCDWYPGASAAVLTASTGCIVFWCSHLRHAPLRGVAAVGRVIAEGVADLLRLSLYVVLCTLPVLAFSSSDGCISPRESARMLLAAIDPVVAEIQSRASMRDSLVATGLGLTVPRHDRVDSAVVAADGAIVVRSVDPQVVLVLLPELVRGIVHWRCVTAPDVGFREECVRR